MSEIFSSEDSQLLEMLSKSRTQYGRWRSNFLKAGKIYVFDNPGFYTLDMSENIFPPSAVRPILTTMVARPEREESLVQVIDAANIAAINLAHLFIEGGIIITSQNPTFGAILQFGLPENIDRDINGFTQLFVQEAIGKGLNIPGIQEYESGSQITIIDPNILSHMKKVGIWFPGIRRQTRIFGENKRELEINPLLEVLRSFIDTSFGKINPPSPDTVWRRLIKGDAEIFTRSAIAEDVARAFFEDLPGSINSL